MDKTEQRYMDYFKNIDDYEYIKSYRKGDILPNGKIVGDNPYIQVKHKFCGRIYEVVASAFISSGTRCNKCCGKYENSFAYHIEVELGLDINKVWDFERNKINPYHITKASNRKVWIKCQEKEYHSSYEVTCDKFTRGRRCPLCSKKSGKVHAKDSFAQYHIENTDINFIEKYWSDKNIESPWEIAPMSDKKIWIKCQNEEINKLNGLAKKEYHPDYEIQVKEFTKGGRCGYCHPSGKNPKVHIYDSFGYYNFDKVQSWSLNNEISPFRVTKSSNIEYKFICETCKEEFKKDLSSIYFENSWCSKCVSKYKGEREISRWLRDNKIFFETQKQYDELLSDKGVCLRYDFYLPDYNLLIEYQGEFHDGNLNGSNRSFYSIETQQEHDRRKRKFANSNNIDLLEIWYYDFKNINNILQTKLENKEK